MLPSGRIFALGINDQAHFLDDSLSFILESHDMGLTWNTIWQGLNYFAQDMSFSTDEQGYLITRKNILQTFDGGYSWDFKDILDLQYNLKNIFILDETTIFAITYGHDKLEFLISTDSGDTWDINRIEYIRGDYKLNFATTSAGYLYGDDLFKTNDQGENWNRIDESLRDRILNVDFTNTQEGYAVGDKGLYRSHDGGNSWNLSFEYGGPPGKVEMINDSVGWLINSDFLFKTENTGEEWEQISISSDIVHYSGISFYDQKFGMIHSNFERNIEGAEFYTHYITHDGGESWSKIIRDTDCDDCKFDKIQILDSKHIYSINRNGLWFSDDTLNSWKRIYDPGSGFIGTYSFHFYDQNYGLLIHSVYEGLFTVDGGLSWITYDKPKGNQPSDCIILGADIFSRYRTLEIGRWGNMLQCNFDSNGNLIFSRVLTTYTKNNLYDIGVFVEDQHPNIWVAGDGFSIIYREFEKMFTGIEMELSKSSYFILHQNYPNPFNPMTIIEYSIDKPAFVSIEIYNILGEKIIDLINEFHFIGQYRVTFDGSSLPSPA